MNKEFLHALLAEHTPSGYEKNAHDVIINHLKAENVPHKFEFADKANNICVSLEPKAYFGGPKIMISGHIDEIGLQVQYIDDKGFIHFIKDGGIDPKVLLGSTVTIMGAHGEVTGVIGKQPIHIEFNSDAKNKATEIKDMKIDVGAETKDDVIGMGISVGDYIIINDIPRELGANRFCGRGLDDKVGAFVAFEVLKELAKVGLKRVKVYAVGCTQEEVGGTGAITAARRINPNISIDYDVTFATDDDYVSPNEWGDIKLGKGGAIAFGTDSNKELSNFMRDVCKDTGIPYQEFSVRSGATNTVHIKKTSNDAATMLLSIPNRNMHTQTEVCDYRDLQSLIDMTVAAILKIDRGHEQFD